MRTDTFAIVLFAVCTLLPAYGQNRVSTVGDATVRHGIQTIEEQWHKALVRVGGIRYESSIPSEIKIRLHGNGDKASRKMSLMEILQQL